MQEDKGIWVYDLELLINCFTYTAINRDTQEIVQFVIWTDQNELQQLLDHLKQVKGGVGFNNLNFDYPIIHYLLTHAKTFKDLSGEDIANQLYLHAQSLIKQKWSAVKEDEVIIQQLDLFRIHHFDNKAKITNLKKLEINMDFDNVQDMPFHHGTEITTKEQVTEILSYNLNDVKATLAFYEKTKDKISLRAGLVQKYDLPCLNYPDSKIGEQLMLKLFCEHTGKQREKVNKQRTYRNKFRFAECIPPYIKFQTKEFQGLLDYLKTIEVRELKESFHYSFTYNNFTFDLGTGGLHGCLKPGIYESDDKYTIVDADVASLYPYLGITLDLYPEHLGEQFSYIYEQEIVQPRIEAKKRGDKVMADGFKLAANSVYGKSNSEYSFLYDPLYTLKTTLGGQLALCLLSEMLLTAIPELQMIQINTDGLTVKIPVEHRKLYWDVCKIWERNTKLQLEWTSYSKMIIRDVNTYIAVGRKDGKIKYKGALRPKSEGIKDGEWHKNYSQDVVVQAVNKYFLEGIPVEKTIKEHTKIYDFCKLFSATHGWSCETFQIKQIEKNYEATRLFYINKGWYEVQKDFFIPPQNEVNGVENVLIIPVSDKLTEVQYNIEQQQKTNRYFVSNKGKIFRKKKDDRIISIEADALVTIFNKYEKKDFHLYNVNYEYYILECEKIIKTIDGTAEKEEQERKKQVELDKLKREEENYLKFCVNKVPTQRQYNLYRKDWLITKYGEPKEIKKSKELLKQC